MDNITHHNTEDDTQINSSELKGLSCFIYNNIYGLVFTIFMLFVFQLSHLDMGKQNVKNGEGKGSRCGRNQYE